MKTRPRDVTTDVAVIGLACRFPGAANAGDFWRLIRDGREVTQLPGDVADFDADFFNLSPREASAMDPRQRLALELAWELFEDAFLVPETLRGEQVSVYLGAMTDDYAFLTLRRDGQPRPSLVRRRQPGNDRQPGLLCVRAAGLQHDRRFRSIVVTRGGAPRLRKPAHR